MSRGFTDISTVPRDRETERSAARRPEGAARGEWATQLPLVVLAAVIGVLAMRGGERPHEWATLLPLLNGVMATATSLLVALLAGRSFVAGQPLAVLLLGAGALTYGLASGFAGWTIPQGRLDWGVVVFNVGALLSGAWCVVAGIGITMASRRRPPWPRSLTLALAYSGVAALVGSVVMLAPTPWMPTFYDPEKGFTAVRQAVLLGAIIEFTVAGALLYMAGRAGRRSFIRVYGLGMGMIALGLAGVFEARVLGSALSWAGRAGQYLGCLYMLGAVVQAVRQSRRWTIPLDEALRESEERFQGVFENAGIGIALCDGEQRFVTANPTFLGLLGYGLEELQRRTVGDVTHEEDRGIEQTLLGELLEGKRRAFELEKRFVRKDGGEVWVRLNTSAVHDAQGRVSTIIKMVQDITEAKRVQQTLRESRERLSLAATAARLFAFEWNPATDEMKREGDSLGILGVARNAEPAAEFFARLHPEDAQRFRDLVRSLGPGQESYTTTYRVIRPEGGEAVLEESGRGFFGEDGKLVRLIGMTADITERRRAEQALRESEERFRTLAENNPDIIMRMDRQHRHLYVGPGIEAVTGIPSRLFVGKTCREVGMPAAPCDTWEAGLRRAFGGEMVTLEFEAEDRQGRRRRYSLRLVPERGTSGEVQTVLCIARDITELSEAQAELLRAKNVAEAANQTKDHFLAVLSHELRTPLTPALMLVMAHEQNEELPERLREDLKTIQRNLQLEARIIDDLLDLSRVTNGKMRMHLQKVSIQEVVRQALGTCAAELASRKLEVSLACEAAHDVVHGDPARLQQVIWNLAKNAAKFTHEGGTVRVTCRNREVGEVEVEVSDTGIGMEPEMLTRIFKAFEQGNRRITRQFGGLGLGLAISKAITELHGGRISAQSDGPGRGATFRVVLPTADGVTAADGARPGPPAGAAVRKGLKLLLVEDHVDTARTLARLLRMSGHEVALAGGVAEGLAALARENFDVLLSDLGLPDGNGHELMRETKRRYGMAGICMSGYGMETDLEKSREAGFAAHLTKPVQFEHLEETIWRVAREQGVVEAGGKAD